MSLPEYEGIPVLPHGETTRYLDHQVGTGALTEVNWAIRIRNVRRRLATATRVATSVSLRVLLLNVIMLPGILFTAAVFDIPHWAEEELRNLHKQILWKHATATERSRHKVNPGILYTPRAAGGVGLVSIDVAVKTQQLKLGLLWLTQRVNRYVAAILDVSGGS